MASKRRVWKPIGIKLTGFDRNPKCSILSLNTTKGETVLDKIINCVAEGFERCFYEPQIEQMARDCKFVQRKSKLTGYVFVKTLVFGCIQYPKATLKQLCQIVSDFGVTIKPQGLDQRLNAQAVVLMRQMLSHVLGIAKAQRREVAEVLDQFIAVYFLDRTIISLPATL